MAEDQHEARMKALDARLTAARASIAPRKSHQEQKYSQANMAWRMVTELVAGLGIGFGVGYGLDWLFGTTPFLMVLFILLGFAAGVKTMMRTAAEMQNKRHSAAAPETGPGPGK
ncbi:MAG: AtpZ/AtpI family protein [Qingshengfaniella sp.]